MEHGVERGHGSLVFVDECGGYRWQLRRLQGREDAGGRGRGHWTTGGGGCEALPHIHGVVFDLPHAVAQASHVEGVEYVGGDMFQSVPSGDAIFMKLILHDWGDERCIEILRNCMAALPDHGKVIISDVVVPEEENTSFKVLTTYYDLAMHSQCDGGKERTKAQWTKLLIDAGFARIQFVQVSPSEAVDQWLIEGYKTG